MLFRKLRSRHCFVSRWKSQAMETLTYVNRHQCWYFLSVLIFISRQLTDCLIRQICCRLSMSGSVEVESRAVWGWPWSWKAIDLVLSDTINRVANALELITDCGWDLKFDSDGIVWDTLRKQRGRAIGRDLCRQVQDPRHRLPWIAVGLTTPLRR